MPKISERRKATLEKNKKKPILFITLKKPKPTDPLDSREGFCYKDDMDEDDDYYVDPDKSESFEQLKIRRKKLPTKRDLEEVNKRKPNKNLVPTKPSNTGGVKRKHGEEYLKEQIKRRCRKHNERKEDDSYSYYYY